MITVAVEGDTDVPFVTALCTASGFEVRSPLVTARGKESLEPFVIGFAQAARSTPHLVVRDLDQDAPCAPTWLAANAPRKAGPFFCLRLAVRAVEAWFLADREAAAGSLHVAEHRIPRAPDDETDPKLTVVNLARLSNKPQVRKAVVPPSGFSRKAGPGYGGWLLTAGERWSFERAVRNSPSLARAHRRLTDLRHAWERASS